jgi:signal transduction histidine kinase
MPAFSPSSCACGEGLRGLVDRVEALGGRVALESPASAGTRLLVEIPVAG